MLYQIRLITQQLIRHFKVLLALGTSTFVFGACSGGSGTGELTVTAIAGTGGSISPASVTVVSGDTASFTLTADTGYLIDGASGCAGSLSGNTYATGAITANCTVTASFKRLITVRELVDPTPGSNDKFGDNVVLLPNGNVVVTDPYDSSVAANNGAVHLYDPTTQTLIASFYGDNSGDQLGVSEIVVASNSHFAIVSINDDVGGVLDAGSVMLIDGNTGTQIGTTIAGDNSSDLFGSGSVIALNNNNFVIGSNQDNVAGVVNAGSVRLINGDTGAQIGPTIVGDDSGDGLSLNGLYALPNNNFVVCSSRDDVGGVFDAGSVQLFNGNTGAQIGPTMTGDDAFDQRGINGVAVLGNNNYVVISSRDKEGGFVNAGSVRLMNGNTGVEINVLSGDLTNDQIGSDSVVVLGNDNFVVASSKDDIGGVVDAGSVRLVDGSTGVQIGPAIVGDNNSDQFGFPRGVVALGNNNFVVTAYLDDVAGITDAGSVRLIDGTTGLQIGSAISGNNTSDEIGRSAVIALSNNNFAVASHHDDVSGFSDVGSVILVDGVNGGQVGAPIIGDIPGDILGNSGLVALANNNFFIISSDDDENGIANSGSIRLVDGSTGSQIGVPLVGEMADDALGSTPPAKALATNNIVVVSKTDDENGITDAGSARVVSGTTGLQIGDPVTGSVAGDFNNLDPDVSIALSPDGLYFVLGQPFARNGGLVNAGKVRVVVP